MAGKADRVAGVVSSVVGNLYRRKADRPNDKAAEECGQERRGESVGPGEALRSVNRSGADKLRLHQAHRSADSSSVIVYLKTGVLRQRRLPGGLRNRREPH